MAKKKHDDSSDPEYDGVPSEQMEQLDEGAIVEEQAQTSHSPATLRAMFATIGDHDAGIAALESRVDEAKRLRSEAVKAFATAMGNKGPWTIAGKRVAVSVRGDSYTLRSVAEDKATL